MQEETRTVFQGEPGPAPSKRERPPRAVGVRRGSIEAAAFTRDVLDHVWARRAVFNIAGASRFSSDHTVRQYATDIWGIEPIKVDLKLLGEPE